MKLLRSGFSLMEMLMVLLVIALLSMSFFAFQQRGMEVDKAEDLGYRLFEYGQALGDYLRSEGKNYPHKPEEPIQLVYEGYAWLQEKLDSEGNPYLDKDFSLVVDPLFVENIPGQQTPLLTEISVFHDPATNTYHLQLDLVTVGPVYSRNDYTTDEEGVRTRVQDVSLIARAVNYANEYRDTIKGSGIIKYKHVEINAQNPPAEPPPGTEPPPPAPPAFTSPTIIQGTITDTSLWNDAWLLRSGENTMQGPINFDGSATGIDNSINNLGKIVFGAAGGTTMDANTLKFVSPGAISNLQTLTFAAGGTIQNVDKIAFQNNRVFNGLQFIGSQLINGQNDAPDRYYQVIINSQPVPYAKNLCYVSGFYREGHSNTSLNFTCRIYQDTGDLTYHLQVAATRYGYCEVTCYNFAP
jgi:prepilin-type N-terminal cleavage/methylation domain-containing protein